MNYLSVEQLSKNYGEKVLFREIFFGISKGQKAALVAKNGAGKTTLLNVIAGLETQDSGKVTLRKEITMAFLQQEPKLDESATVLETIFSAQNAMTQAVRDYERILFAQEENPESVSSDVLQAAMNELDSLGAWDYEAKVKQILSRLLITYLDRPIGQLSGGQKKRVALAQILVAEPDFIIMDEPTNHLDLEMIEWLEQFLSNPNLTLLLVTHDRYFLDNICDQIIELSNGNIYQYAGNYQYFLEKKAERIFNESREIDKARNLMRTELEWIRRQPKARGTKAKARIDAFDVLKEKATAKKEEAQLQLNVKMTRIGGKIMEIKNLIHGYGDLKILQNFTYTFKPKDRIGIVGRNGVGKSTFLNIILGLEKPNAGQVNVGETIVFGYYKQDGLTFRPDQRVIDVVKDIAEVIPLAPGEKVSAAQFLTLFQFEPPSHYTEVGRLSGGERRRLHLLTVLMKNPNFLVLDEPTNDLDLITLNVLEEFLQNYEGCLVVVSHDRYFMNKLVDHLFVFEGNGVVKDFNGTYSDYRFEKAEEESQKKELETQKQKAAAAEKTAAANKDKKKMSFKEQREYQLLEKEIETLETEKSELTQKMSSGAATHTDITAWANRISQIETDLETKTERWLELAEMAG